MELSSDELKEVLNIFRAESTEQIKLLNSGFLELEKNSTNKKNMEEIFRTAHSIKGAARMLGLLPIEYIAHELEDALGSLKNGKLEIKNFDILYTSVDEIERIINTLSASEKPDLSSINVDAIVNDLKRMQNKEVKETPKSTKAKKKEPEIAKEENIFLDDAEPLFKNLDSSEILHPVHDEIHEEHLTQAPIATISKLDDFEDETEIEKDRKETTNKRIISEEFIRISISQIDSIMNRVNQLVTSKVNSYQQLQQLQKLNITIKKQFKDFESNKNLIDSIEKQIAKATESVNINLYNEKQIRAMLRLLINANILIKRLHKDVNEMSQNQINEILKTTSLIDEVQTQIRDVRLLPLNTMLDLMPRMVRDISKLKNKKVSLEIVGGDTKIDKQILEEIKDPLIHLIRNCIDHGLEEPDERVVNGKKATGKIRIKALYEGNSVLIEVSDDGRGINKEKIIKKALKEQIITENVIDQLSEQDIFNIVFLSGFSTQDIITDISGRGVGMDVVKTNIEKLKGLITIHSEKGKGTTFKIRLPLTLATIQVLIIESGHEKYTIPVISIERLVHITHNEIETLSDKEYVKINDQFIPLARLDELLEKPRKYLTENKKKLKLSEAAKDEKLKFPVVVCVSAEKKLAIIVDKLIDEQEVYIKDLGKQFKRVKNVMGATLLGNGELAIMLDPADLVKSIFKSNILQKKLNKDAKVKQKIRVLVVDDSITTRTLEKNILEQAGYDVTIAVHGQNAWEILNEKSNFDIIVSDVEMPYLTGFELVSKIKTSEKFADIPCILCTSLESEADKRKGVDAGANAYITKGSFNQRTLLDTIERLI